MPKYAPDSDAVAALRDLLVKWNEKAPAVSRFTSPLADKYSKVAAHGYNTWASSKAMCVHPDTHRPCDAVEALG